MHDKNVLLHLRCTGTSIKCGQDFFLFCLWLQEPTALVNKSPFCYFVFPVCIFFILLYLSLPHLFIISVLIIILQIAHIHEYNQIKRYGGIFLQFLVRSLCWLFRYLCWLVSYSSRLVRSSCWLVRKISSQLEA